MPLIIEIDKIQTELQELVGGEIVKVKIDKRQERASRLICTDNKNVLYLNPSKIRSQNTLDRHIDIAREELGR